MAQALLIGTVHHDRNGERKIQAALEEFNPTHVLIEGSKEAQEGIAATRKLALEIFDELEINNFLLKRLLLYDRDSLLRDANAAQEFLSRNPDVIGRFYNDEAAPNEEGLLAEFEAATRENLQQLRNFPNNAIKKMEHQIAHVLEEKKRDWKWHTNMGREAAYTERSRYDDWKNLNARDQIMWNVFKKTCLDNPDGRIASITGMGHITESRSPETLYDHIVRDGRIQVTRRFVCFE